MYYGVQPQGSVFEQNLFFLFPKLKDLDWGGLQGGRVGSQVGEAWRNY